MSAVVITLWMFTWKNILMADLSVWNGKWEIFKDSVIQERSKAVKTKRDKYKLWRARNLISKWSAKFEYWKYRYFNCLEQWTVVCHHLYQKKKKKSMNKLTDKYLFMYFVLLLCHQALFIVSTVQIMNPVCIVYNV